MTFPANKYETSVYTFIHGKYDTVVCNGMSYNNARINWNNLVPQ